MNQQLWNKILQFDFDDPPSEYGFSIRLANENYWTQDFTRQAMLEYKKFMYLAATSDMMVSPSEIVDTVWHQHLIFTQSYQEFCELIGKQVQHIPSTHNKEDADKFRRAKERTKNIYTEAFGEQPTAIWAYGDMYESLNLEKAKINIRTFINFGILALVILTVPVYFLLKPVYLTINNPYFIQYFMVLAVFTLVALEIHNRYKLRQMVSEFDKNSFIYQLQPLELVYLKTQKLGNVINGTINELVEKRTILINDDYSIELSLEGTTGTIEQMQATNTLHDLGRVYYPELLKNLATKPVFWNTANCMDAFKKYFNKSKKFGWLFYLNFSALSIVFLLGFTRVVTGTLRDKPVGNLSMIIFLFVIVAFFYLQRLTNMACTNNIPNLYKHELLPAMNVESNWQWGYFLRGTDALTASFIPLVNYTDKNNSSVSSCGTSCGSSCGSSCGGCGGCGGGD